MTARIMSSPAWLKDLLLREALNVVQAGHENLDRIRLVVDTALDRFDTTEGKQVDLLIERFKGHHGTGTIAILGPPLLHRLILCTSDEFANAENAESSSHKRETITARYLQHVVLLGVTHWSRWMAIGIGQLVYAYDGPSVDLMLGALSRRDYARQQRQKNKSKIIQRLTERFRDLRVVLSKENRPSHFHPVQPHEQDHDFVVGVLTLLAPWDPLTWAGREWMQSVEGLKPDWKELDHCRRLTYPKSFSELTTALGLKSPREMLRLPRIKP